MQMRDLGGKFNTRPLLAKLHTGLSRIRKKIDSTLSATDGSMKWLSTTCIYNLNGWHLGHNVSEIQKYSNIYQLRPHMKRIHQVRKGSPRLKAEF